MNDNSREQIRTDEGWQQMRQLLDQEMPVKKRRRALLWIPMTLLLAIAGTIALYAGFQHEKNKQPVPTSNKEAIASSEKPQSTYLNSGKNICNIKQLS